MNHHKSTQGNNNSQKADRDQGQHHSLLINSPQEEEQSFSKNQETGNIKELINILSIIALRVAVKRQKQEQSNT